MIHSYENSLHSVRRKMIFNFSMLLVGIALILGLVILGFYFLEKRVISESTQQLYLEQLRSEQVIGAEVPKIISQVSESMITAQNGILQDNLSILFGVLFVLSSIPSFYIAQSVARKKIYALKRKHFAYFDDVTGLPSCNMLIDRLNHIFAQSRRYNHKFSILYMNVDSFADINNSWGKEVGDRVLKVIAERLVSSVRNSDTVAYIGDDEFAIILSVVGDASDADVVAKKIIKKMAAPFTHEGEEKYLGMSIGVSTYPDNGVETESLLNKADKAMIIVKNTIKNGFLHSE
ncbi:MAG: GGDEF domain-containing protein [Fibrobacterales bacterium]